MRLLSENQSNRIVRRRKKQPRWLPTFQKIPNQGFKSFINVRSQPLSTIPSKDLLKSKIEDLLNSKTIDLERTLWLYDPKRCWVDVLVRRVYLGGTYNRRHCKSDCELMVLCPKKAFTAALQMHFNGDDNDHRFELLKRLREQ